MKLCCALIYPFLTYGILLRGNTYETTLKPTFILQKKAVCIITFSKLDKIVTPVHYLIKFFDIALFQIAIVTKKVHNNVLPAVFHSFFTKVISVHNNIIILDLQQTLLLSSLCQNQLWQI